MFVTPLLGVASQPGGVAGVRFAAGTSAPDIPFDLVDGRIVLHVSVNGTAPAAFILDTGASANVVSLRDARSTGLGLVPWTGGFVGIGASPPDVSLATDAVTFSLPGVTLSDSHTLAMSLDETRDCLGPAPDIHGFLGAPLFRAAIVKIDYAAKRLSLYEPRTYRYRGNGRSVPIEMDATYTYTMVSIAAKKGAAVRAKLVVDTGAGALSLTKQFAAAHTAAACRNARAWRGMRKRRTFR